jgi:hypothetical protein
VAAAEEPAEKSAAPAVAPLPVGAGDCTARVVTDPKDAKVIWGGAVIGRSPIDAASVPCGPAKVTIERDRWQVVTVDVNARAGAPASIRERLHRPRGTLILSSVPPGAQIVVNHIAVGATPKQIDVLRYEKVPIRATLKGHQPWTKTVYIKDSQEKLEVHLVPRK